MRNNYIKRRIQSDLRVSQEVYENGIIDLLEYIFVELDIFLIRENRYRGIMVSYLDSILKTYARINSKEISNEQKDVYGRIIFLYKPLILQEYHNLCEKRRLSKADALIVIIKILLEIVLEDTHNSNYSEIKSIHKIIEKIYDNIRNNGKKTSLYVLTNTIKTYMAEGLVGKYSSEYLSILEEESKIIPTDGISGDGTELEQYSGKIMEISWGK